MPGEWQDIATAPQQPGLRALLFIPPDAPDSEGLIVQAELCEGPWRDGITGEVIDTRLAWLTPYDVCGGNTVTDLASHWMPLPPLPRRSAMSEAENTGLWVRRISIVLFVGGMTMKAVAAEDALLAAGLMLLGFYAVRAP